ncbi:MAG: GntR family transcriptional regulator [Hyphomicrobiaceae bacterium]
MTRSTRAEDHRPKLVGPVEDGTNLARSLRREMMEKAAVAGRPKRTAVRLAIAALIASETLRPGDPLPSEKALAALLGVSLGTVQAALKQLQDMGAIVRRRGDGTRVASAEPLPTSIWHFRVVDTVNGHPLRFTRQTAEVDVIDEAGPWSFHLGARDSYLRIRRRMRLTTGVHIGAEMFLAADSVPGLAETDPQELVMVNIRPYLEERFGLAATRATHVVRQTRPVASLAMVLGLNARVDHFEISACTFDGGGGAVYFQRIFVPTGSCALSF